MPIRIMDGAKLSAYAAKVAGLRGDPDKVTKEELKAAGIDESRVKDLDGDGSINSKELLTALTEEAKNGTINIEGQKYSVEQIPNTDEWIVRSQITEIKPPADEGEISPDDKADGEKTEEQKGPEATEGDLPLPAGTPGNLAAEIRYALNDMPELKSAIPPRVDESFDRELLALYAKHGDNIPVKELKALYEKHLYSANEVNYDRVTDEAMDAMFGNGDGKLDDGDLDDNDKDTISLAELKDRLEFYKGVMNARAEVMGEGFLSVLAKDKIILVDSKEGLKRFKADTFLARAKKNKDFFKKCMGVAIKMREIKTQEEYLENLKYLDASYEGEYPEELLANLYLVYEISFENKMQQKKVKLDKDVDLKDEATAEKFFNGVFAEFVENGTLPADNKGELYSEIDMKVVDEAYNRQQKEKKDAIAVPAQ